jgi:hypothetical protein
VLLRNGLTIDEAQELEAIFINAIGREPKGPLLNRNDGRREETADEFSAGRELTALLRLRDPSREPRVPRYVPRRVA